MTSEVMAVLTSAHRQRSRVPDALQRHSASKTRVNALVALLRKAGTHLAREHGAAWAPALQRITPQLRRAALRPGHGSPHVTACTT
ncbi:hypothetical protein ACVIIV_005585 [Bradyrhizobium sp. USDA 4354]